MRAILDLQCTQKEHDSHHTRHYTIPLAQAIVRNRAEHEIIVALSGLYPETIERFRGAFNGLLPQENIRLWQVPGMMPGNIRNRALAEQIRNTFFAALNPDIVHRFSLRADEEGAVPHVLCSDTLSGSMPRALSDHPAPAHLFLLAATQSLRSKAMAAFGMDAASVVHVSGALHPGISGVSINAQQRQLLREKYKLTRPYIWCASTDDEDERALIRLVSAYARLSPELLADHHLVFSCKHSVADTLRREAGSAGLPLGSTVFIEDCSSDESAALHSMCKLSIIPSWSGGFCSPVLEAMAFGRAFVAPLNPDVLEVTGCEDALFEPGSTEAMTGKLAQALADAGFRNKLEEHGPGEAGKFSWDLSGKCAIEAFERWHENNAVSGLHAGGKLASDTRPKLAYISPLPPERSGISEYSAELLPELAQYYAIDVIVQKNMVSDPWIKANCTIRSAAWFKKHAGNYDRVLYHFGNSMFHQHMFDLLDHIPGVVVLHDFFLSGVVEQMESKGVVPDFWKNELYRAHGYPAITRFYHENDRAPVVFAYPCNHTVLQHALGVVVHSPYSLRLAGQWYGIGNNDAHWAAVPHLRVPAGNSNRAEARHALGISEEAFVVCSFGMLGALKLNDRLLQAWMHSALAGRDNCRLVFVGENPNNDYGRHMADTITQSGQGERLHITGWVDSRVYRNYLAAADVAVQLRTLSRGESSGAVLDCMNYGRPTIINANGSMADLPADATLMLPDDFTDEQLTTALETLWRDESLRRSIGSAARDHIRREHDPQHVARKYFEAIETFSRGPEMLKFSMIRSIASLRIPPKKESGLIGIAKAIAETFPPPAAQRQLLVDVSALVHRDLKTGIQRVVRSIIKNLVENTPEGYRIEPVYATTETSFRYARNFTMNMFECPEHPLEDDPVEIYPQDILFIPDLHYQVVKQQAPYFQNMRNRGASVMFLVHDLLPTQYPDYFPPGSLAEHRDWLDVVMQTDGAICVSRTIADDLYQWISRVKPERHRPFMIGWNHNGGDIQSSVPSKGFPAGFEEKLRQITAGPSLLMVGTVEPRKGHAQTLKAFEILWRQGVQVNLVIVGKQGWMVDELVASITRHNELGKRLFWFQGISDEALLKLYSVATGTIMASEGEGFGLPLIEAAQHGCAILARDIPVFREIAGPHAAYFSGTAPDDLSKAIRHWLVDLKKGSAPQSALIPWITWKQNAEQLVRMLNNPGDPNWVHCWVAETGAHAEVHQGAFLPDDSHSF